MRFPAWLKILLILGLLSIIFSVLGAVSEFLIAPVFLLAFILFPGPDKAKPRLVKILPWLWILGMVVSIVFLIAELAGKKLLGAEARTPTPEELVATIVITPPLVWSLVNRHRSFRALMIASAVIFIGMEFWVYSQSAGELKALFELVGGMTAELMMAVYLLMKVRLHKS